MRKKYIIVSALCAIVFAGVSAAFAADVTKAAVQGQMKAHIDKKVAEGKGAYVIQGVKTSFVRLHGDVRSKDGFLISCAEFKAGNVTYDVDVYARGSGSHYAIVREVLHKKNGQEANERLWP
jgi:hypothetical protein